MSYQKSLTRFDPHENHNQHNNHYDHYDHYNYNKKRLGYLKFQPSRFGTMEVDPADSSASTRITATTSSGAAGPASSNMADAGTTTLTSLTATTLTSGGGAASMGVANGGGGGMMDGGDDDVYTTTSGGGYNENCVPSYLDYPMHKPYVNTDFTIRDTGKAVNTYPTSDRDAVLSALRNLQDKVKKLELERMAAEHNLEALASHTEQYKEMVNGERDRERDRSATSTNPSKLTKSTTSTSSSHPQSWSLSSGKHQYSSLTNGRAYVNSQTKELDGQLSSAENRCQLLEKQLDYMKKLVDDSERDRRQLVEKTLKAKQQQQQQQDTPDIRLHLDRLNDLERDQLRLNANQNLTENGMKNNAKAKIRELEGRVGEEKLFRKNLQGKATELESAYREKKSFPSSKPHMPSSPTPTPIPVTTKPSMAKTKKSPKKKVKKKPATSHTQQHRPISSNNRLPCKSESNRHYRLNLAEIPFVAGKSTTPSHALGANVQKVLAMMKSHNAALCSQIHPHNNHQHHNHHQPNSDQGQRSASPSSSRSGSSVTSCTVDQDLTDLLNQLQEEFRQLSSEHQDLVDQLNGATDKGERLDLEQETEVMVSRMEAKAQQITKIRQHQNKYEEKKLSSSKSPKSSKRPHSAGGRLVSTSNHQHHHNNIHHSNQNKGTPRVNSGKPVGNSALGKPALFMLRDMKKLQTTLRRDDLCWN